MAASPASAPSAPRAAAPGGGKGKVAPTAKRLRENKERKLAQDKDGVIPRMKAAYRRIARRAGVKRISPDMYILTNAILRRYLNLLLADAAVLMDHGRRKTVTALDVVYAAKKRGQDLYGYGYLGF